MTKDHIFKIELQRAIANYSENTLMGEAKEIVRLYSGDGTNKSGLSGMKPHQMESLARLARSISETRPPGKTVITFINKQGEKNTDEKSKTWAWAPDSSPIPFYVKLVKSISNQSKQAVTLFDEVQSHLPEVLINSKLKKEFVAFAQNMLVKDLITFIVSWYYVLAILPQLEEA